MIKNVKLLILGMLSTFIFTSAQAQSADATIEDWPDTAKKAAKATMDKLGEPDEITASMLVWEDADPYVRVIAYKQEIQHDFPAPHKDVLEHFINYDVPAEKFDELAMFDGSLIVERTKGEMSARCDSEAHNLIALNLANDIIMDNLNVKEAREKYASTVMAQLKGENPEYIQSIQFSLPQENITNPDETIMDMSKVKELKNKKKQK